MKKPNKMPARMAFRHWFAENHLDRLIEQYPRSYDVLALRQFFWRLEAAS